MSKNLKQGVDDILDRNTIANLASIYNSKVAIREINKRYIGNQTVNSDVKASVKMTLIWLLLNIFILGLLFILGFDLIVSIVTVLIFSIISIITILVFFNQVTRSGLNISSRIILDEGYGQLILFNGEIYFTDYINPHSKQESFEMVYQYVIDKQIRPGLHIYKLLDIKHVKTKKYRGRQVDIIGCTYDYLTNPVKLENERLCSVKIPVFHSDVNYNDIINLPRFIETEEDRTKDKKDLLKSFIVTTTLLPITLFLSIGFWFAVTLCFPVMFSWSCTTNELNSHTFLRYTLRLYIIIICIIGIINLLNTLHFS